MRAAYRAAVALAVVGLLATFGALVVPPAGSPGAAATPASGRTTGSTSAPSTTVPASPPTTATPPTWLTAWATPMDFNYGVAVNATVRDVAEVAVSGTSIRLRISNSWSGVPITFGAVTVGVQQSPTAGAAVLPGTLVPVTFGGGSPAVTIPARQDVTSDPVAMAVHAGETLSVSLWLEGSAPVSVHFCCQGRIDSYGTYDDAGNRTADPTAASFPAVAPYASTNMRWLSGIQVAGSPAQGTVVAFGDSITDGFRVAGDGWPTPLQQRISMMAPQDQMAVVNQGVTGNTLTVFPPGNNALGDPDSYALVSGGLPGLTRLGSDVLSIPGAKDVVLFLGTNDIWFGGEDAIPPYGSAATIIAGMQSVIAQVHAAGMRIFGVTLLPRASSPPGIKPVEVWTAADQATLDQVNAWIRTPGNGFDGVIDMGAVVADVYNGQCNPDLLFGPYNSGDNLHPSVAGQTVMANAVPTTFFQIPEAPQLPAPVAVTPTPGCPGAVLAEQAMALAQVPTPSPPPTTVPPTTVPVRHPTIRRPATTGSLWWVPAGVAVAVVAAGLVLLRRRAVLRRRRRRAVLGQRPGVRERAPGSGPDSVTTSDGQGPGVRPGAPGPAP